MGAIALVMMASGRLSKMPRNNPTAQPGQGSRILQITNPRPNRAINAPSIAARLSGKLRGIISATSTPPKMSPQSTPRGILDMVPSSGGSSNRIAVHNSSDFFARQAARVGAIAALERNFRRQLKDARVDVRRRELERQALRVGSLRQRQAGRARHAANHG